MFNLENKIHYLCFVLHKTMLFTSFIDQFSLYKTIITGLFESIEEKLASIPSKIFEFQKYFYFGFRCIG